MTKPSNENNGNNSDVQQNRFDGLHKYSCLQRVPKKFKRSLLVSLLVLMAIFKVKKEVLLLASQDFHHLDQHLYEAISQQHGVHALEESKVDHNSSSGLSKFLMYVMTLQGVKGAKDTNAGRYDQFQRHWNILCHNDDPRKREHIHFHKCLGHLNPRGSDAGYGLSAAFLECFHWALKHHKQWHKEHNPDAQGLDDDDSIPFVFLEDDARLYNSNFCDSEYRNRIWKSVPQTNATLLMLGGHGMGFYDPKHPIAKVYQDHNYNETILMDPSDLPQIVRPRRGFGSYGFALLNTPTVEYMTRKMDKMLNRTFNPEGMRGFKAIDQQFHHYSKLKTYMSYPWLVYHEGGLYSNTKGAVRGEFGDGSKQYRWVDGLTGSAKNCTGVEDLSRGSVVKSKTSNHQHYHEETVVVSCRTITVRIPNSLSSWNSNRTSMLVAIVSRSNHTDIRASIRSTWGKLNHDIFFLVAGPWHDIVSEFELHGDLVWLNLAENADTLAMLSSLQVASFLVVAERHLGDHYSHILKVTDHSHADLDSIRSQLFDKSQQKIAIWGSQCGTGVRPSHIKVPETEYSDYFFPQYCKGDGYALSKIFVQCAVSQIPQSRLISLDDAHIGILGERCGLQENQFHSGADVEKGKIPLLQHDLANASAMVEYHASWLNLTSN